MSYLQQLSILCPLIFLSGFVDSIAGGGALISLPAYYMVGLPPHTALGTNKLSALSGSVTSSIRFIKSKSYYLKSLAPSILFALIGSFLGAKLAVFLDESILRVVLIFAMPLLAAFILLKKDFAEPLKKKEISDLKLIILCSAIAFTIGVYDGFFGPGAGTFLILAHLGIVGLGLRESMGNSRIINMTTNISAVVVYFLNGMVDFKLAIPAAVFAILGNYIGTGFAIKNGKKIVRPMMIFVLTLLVAKLAVDAF